MAFAANLAMFLCFFSKVLTFSIAQCLDVDIDKEVLEKYKEKETVSFEDFLDFLKVSFCFFVCW